jgi:hypothetical protein
LHKTKIPSYAYSNTSLYNEIPQRYLFSIKITQRDSITQPSVKLKRRHKDQSLTSKILPKIHARIKVQSIKEFLKKGFHTIYMSLFINPS